MSDIFLFFNSSSIISMKIVFSILVKVCFEFLVCSVRNNFDSWLEQQTITRLGLWWEEQRYMTGSWPEMTLMMVLFMFAVLSETRVGLSSIYNTRWSI